MQWHLLQVLQSSKSDYRYQPTPLAYTFHTSLHFIPYLSEFWCLLSLDSPTIHYKKEKRVGSGREYGEANLAGGCCEGAGGKGEGLGWLFEHIFSLFLQLNKVGLWLVQCREQRKRHPWIPIEGPDWALLPDNAWVYCWNLLTLLHGKPWELQSGGNFFSLSSPAPTHPPKHGSPPGARSILEAIQLPPGNWDVWGTALPAFCTWAHTCVLLFEHS